jgi:hypothetical protein
MLQRQPSTTDGINANQKPYTTPDTVLATTEQRQLWTQFACAALQFVGATNTGMYYDPTAFAAKFADVLFAELEMRLQK